MLVARVNADALFLESNAQPAREQHRERFGFGARQPNAEHILRRHLHHLPNARDLGDLRRCVVGTFLVVGSPNDLARRLIERHDRSLAAAGRDD